ncbi:MULTISPECIES: hypothetical protein [unclassified Imperialibacter]|uniref:hypothetical protein n=1 Tax=unclassified Imperialibacter TaxID=2629706 RepID=UPI0012598845|nr:MULTISPECIES: hypothetical protein [unclassified Imperialibacter]CAD5266835.1 conserved hypothetical protein [Imperialibacter sp. 75]CAD5297174.1 conserved hypothetical protein [Imperialibacter sp. 89]VVT27192.1 hypothetical protein IMPR6_410032 [Imperialibacter sp. EC-SDR9]
MKKIIYLSVFLLFGSCSENFQLDSPDISLPYMHELSRTYDGELFTNVDVEVFSMSNNETLIVVFDNGSRTHFSKAYVLASEEYRSFANNPIFSGNLLQLDGVILLQSNSGDFITLSVDSEVSQAVLKDIKQRGVKESAIRMGYGLSAFKGDWIIDRTKMSSELTAFDAIRLFSTNSLVEPAPNGKVLGCTSGGEGSTSCSIDEPFGLGGCSVDCSEGYYACCDSSAVTCKCDKITNHEQ